MKLLLTEDDHDDITPSLMKMPGQSGRLLTEQPDYGLWNLQTSQLTFC